MNTLAQLVVLLQLAINLLTSVSSLPVTNELRQSAIKFANQAIILASQEINLGTIAPTVTPSLNLSSDSSPSSNFSSSSISSSSVEIQSSSSSAVTVAPIFVPSGTCETIPDRNEISSFRITKVNCLANFNIKKVNFELNFQAKSSFEYKITIKNPNGFVFKEETLTPQSCSDGKCVLLYSFDVDIPFDDPYIHLVMTTETNADFGNSYHHYVPTFININ